MEDIVHLLCYNSVIKKSKKFPLWSRNLTGRKLNNKRCANDLAEM